jgi:hypothetical protein
MRGVWGGHIPAVGRTLVAVTTWLAAAETRTSTTVKAGQRSRGAGAGQAKWFHAYLEGEPDTACGRPLEGLTPTGEEFSGRPSHCPRCDALTATGAAPRPDPAD